MQISGIVPISRPVYVARVEPVAKITQSDRDIKEMDVNKTPVEGGPTYNQMRGRILDIKI